MHACSGSDGSDSDGSSSSSAGGMARMLSELQEGTTAQERVSTTCSLLSMTAVDGSGGVLPFAHPGDAADVLVYSVVQAALLAGIA